MASRRYLVFPLFFFFVLFFCTDVAGVVTCGDIVTRGLVMPSQITAPIPGGEAGQSVSPCEVAGCYAPGGRYPLPSSVIMTAATARAAGVQTVVVASPRPQPVTLAAAHVSGADLLLAAGGAQAIAALALGVGVPKADVVVGPGNKWVTAAKSLISGSCGIDMLAGPSEVRFGVWSV